MADHLEGVRSGHPRAATRAPVADSGPHGEAIRRWARANGYVVNDRGRIPASIREAYETTH
ncbi:histone-like nucleoid-structuring protein Lsr2 [Streptomyces wuyuanensis]|uniref:Lsr2 family DNA-binding protein n=1 Tax=Streptomyces wuyuanensis TaxID=1196353 RepID=UPI003713DCA5